MRIKLDRTVCDGFGTCAVHAANIFSLDDWGYPSLVAGNEIGADDQDAVRRAVLDCPAHAIVVLDDSVALAAGGEAAISRSAGPDAPWRRLDDTAAEAPCAVPVADE